jgi:hypothetical protein
MVTALMVNDLTGNTKATDRQHIAGFCHLLHLLAIFDHKAHGFDYLR